MGLLLHACVHVSTVAAYQRLRDSGAAECAALYLSDPQCISTGRMYCAQSRLDAWVKELAPRTADERTLCLAAADLLRSSKVRSFAGSKPPDELVSRLDGLLSGCTLKDRA